MSGDRSEPGGHRPAPPAPGILRALRDLPPPPSGRGPMGGLPRRRQPPPQVSEGADPERAPTGAAPEGELGELEGAPERAPEREPAQEAGDDPQALQRTPTFGELDRRPDEDHENQEVQEVQDDQEYQEDQEDPPAPEPPTLPLERSLEITPTVAIHALESASAIHVGDGETATPEVDGGGAPATPSGQERVVEERVPPQINRFTVLKLLGSGGMGEVYAAYDPELDRRIALKVLRAQVSQSSSSSTARTRLLREAKALAKLSHPNVVAIYDVGTIDEQIFIAMEFVKGMTLTKWIRSSPEPLADGTQPEYRPWVDVLALFVQAGRGLAAAHKAGIIHRDFKPDNVLIGRDGRVRVVDFGLARADSGHSERPDTFADAIKSLSSQTSSVFELRLTRTDGMAGTPAYMAPEQYLNLQVDARTDQFSFCVALYEGLYGERPFRGDTVARVRKAVINGEISDPPDVRGVPGWLREILVRGLSVHPGARYPSMDALLAELSDDPGRPQRSWLGAALIVGISLTVATLGVASLQTTGQGFLDTSACAAAETELAEVYGESRRADLKEVFAMTGLSDTNQTWRRVDEVLRERTGELIATERRLCILDHLDGPETGGLIALTRSCLVSRGGALRALVHGLGGITSESLGHAVPAVHNLLSLTPCSDPSVLRARADSPEDPALAELSAQLRVHLDDLRAAAWLGDVDDALRAVRQVSAEAGHLEDFTIRSEAYLLQGQLELQRGDEDGAERSLKAALWHAEASRHDVITIDSLTALVELLGVRGSRHDEADLLTPRLTAAVRRLGDRRRDARAQRLLGLADAARGHTDAAIVRLESAATTAAAIPGAYGRLLAATIRSDLGRALGRANRFTEAFAAHQQAIEAYEATMGTNHPGVALATVALCETALAKGDAPLAIKTCRRAVELRGDPAVSGALRAEARFALARANNLARRSDEAVAGARRALEEIDGDPAGRVLAAAITTWLRGQSR